MRSSLFISSLLPLLLVSFITAPGLGQNDSNPFGNAPTGESADDPFAVPIEAVKRETALKTEIAALIATNDALKARVIELEATKGDLETKLEEAPAKADEMHQSLFDSLLFSEDTAHQEFALKHLIACIEKYEATKRPVSLHSVDVHRRLKLLSSSKEKTVREMAAGCLYIFHPSDAARLGIQFGSRWQSLEQVSSDVNTNRIFNALAMPCDLVYDAVPLEEVVEELKMHYGVSVRLAEGIDRKQEVSYDSVGRTLLSSLAGLLESKKLGFAVSDEEIVIMKTTDPKLKAVATYNVSGLDLLAKIKTEQILKMLQEEFTDEGVEFAKVGEHLITAKTDLKRQRQIQERIATLVPATKWSSR